MTLARRVRLALQPMIENAFRPLGYQLHITPIRPSLDYTLFDKNQLLSYYPKNDRRQLYDRAIRLSGVLDSDNFAKQSRYYSLVQCLEVVLRDQVPGDVAECGCWKGHSTYMLATLLAQAK